MIHISTAHLKFSFYFSLMRMTELNRRRTRRRNRRMKVNNRDENLDASIQRPQSKSEYRAHLKHLVYCKTNLFLVFNLFKLIKIENIFLKIQAKNNPNFKILILSFYFEKFPGQIKKPKLNI